MADEDERDETEAERLDRNWNDMLQELRVVQTGVQLLSGFLLTLPFTTRFGDIDVWQQRLYLTLVLLAGLAIGVTLTPIMIHRRVFGEQVKDRVVASGHLFLQVVMVLLALIIIGISTLIFSVVRRLGGRPGRRRRFGGGARAAARRRPPAGRPAQRPGLGSGRDSARGGKPRAPVVSQLPTQLLPVTW